MGPFVWLCKLPHLVAGLTARRSFCQKSYFTTPSTAGSQVEVFLVSVLDLDKTAVVQDQTGSVLAVLHDVASRGTSSSSDVSLYTM